MEPAPQIRYSGTQFPTRTLPSETFGVAAAGCGCKVVFMGFEMLYRCF